MMLPSLSVGLFADNGFGITHFEDCGDGLPYTLEGILLKFADRVEEQKKLGRIPQIVNPFIHIVLSTRDASFRLDLPKSIIRIASIYGCKIILDYDCQ